MNDEAIKDKEIHAAYIHIVRTLFLRLASFRHVDNRGLVVGTLQILIK